MGTGTRWSVVGPAALAVTTSAICIWVFRFFAEPYGQQVGFDEGYEAAVVERIIDGRWLPYVDAVSHRGPFLYWIHAFFQLATGRYEWAGTRALTMWSAVVTILGTFTFGWAARWPLAGAIGGVVYFYVLAVLYDIGPGFGLHGEPVAIAVVMLACTAAAMGSIRASSRHARMTWLFTAGVLVAIATLTKQTLGVMVFPLAAFVALGQLSRPGPRVRGVVVEALLPFIAGGLTLSALVLLRYLVAGELGTFFFWSTGFNSKIYMEPYKGRIAELMWKWFFDQPFAAVGIAFAVSMLVGRPLSEWRRSGVPFTLALSKSAFEIFISASALLLLLAAVYPLRLWPHYFIPVWPFFGLVLGVMLEQSVRRYDEVPLVTGVLIAAAVGWLLYIVGGHRLGGFVEKRSKENWYVNPTHNAACGEIDRIAGPGREPVFMWGTLGDLYISCHRPSSSYFTYTTVVAGIVPPYWHEAKPERAAPGSTEKLLGELTARPPPVILDAPMAGNLKTAMEKMPVLSEFLTKNYCRVSTSKDLFNREIVFWGRNDLAVCKAAKP